MTAPTFKLVTVLAAALSCAVAAVPRSAYCPDGCQCVWLDLVCDDAGLTDVPSSSSWGYVWTIFVNGNKIRSLPDAVFAPYPKLTSFFMNDNALTVMDLSVFARAGLLSELRLARNSISSIVQPRGGFPLRSLVTLDLSFNRLHALDPHTFDVAPALRYLYLDGNPLVLPGNGPLLSHATVSLLSLDSVDASALSSQTLAALPNLNTLSLNASDVRNLSGVGLAAPQLYTLEASGNAVVVLPADAFAPGALLDALRLDDNPLQKVEAEALEVLRPGGLLSIADTPIACDCGYEDVLQWTRDHSVRLNATCSSAPPCAFEGNSAA